MADSSHTTQPQEKRTQQGQRGPRNNNNNNSGNKRFYQNHAQPGNNSPQGPKGDGQPRPKKNNNNQKNNNKRNGTGAAVASNGATAPAPVRHNLSPEVHKKVVDLRQLTNSYFSEGDILNALQLNEFDQERALQQLNAKRTNSWSSVVKKPGVTVASQVQTVVAEAPVPQEQPQQQPPKKNNRKPKNADAPVEPAATVPEPVVQQPPKPQVDTDTKIADLEQQVAKDLSLIENKAQHLKSLQEEIRSVKVERDAQIQSLKEEKERLFVRRQELENELQENKQRTLQIDKEVTHLQQEKDQKIKTLEGKYNSAILNKN